MVGGLKSYICVSPQVKLQDCVCVCVCVCVCLISARQMFYFFKTPGTIHSLFFFVLIVKFSNNIKLWNMVTILHVL